MHMNFSVLDKGKRKDMTCAAGLARLYKTTFFDILNCHFKLTVISMMIIEKTDLPLHLNRPH